MARLQAKLSDINTMLHTSWNLDIIHVQLGQLYYGTAPETEDYPFVTYQIINDQMRFTTCEDLNQYLIQFSIFNTACSFIFDSIDALKEFWSGYSQTYNNTIIEQMLPTNTIIVPKLPNTNYIQGVVNFNLWAGYTP